jgi:hypothetical protein
VTVRLAVVTVTLHVALKPLSFGGPDDVDPLSVFEKSGSGMSLLLAGKLVVAFKTKLLDELLGSRSPLLGLVRALGEVEAALLLVVESNLDGRVAVRFGGLDLKEFVAVHIDDSDGDHAACLCVENASHTDFFTEDSE